jgi:hypothetical protein
MMQKIPNTGFCTIISINRVMTMSVFILQVVMHGEESQVPGDLRQSEILIEYFKI